MIGGNRQGIEQPFVLERRQRWQVGGNGRLHLHRGQILIARPRTQPFARFRWKSHQLQQAFRRRVEAEDTGCPTAQHIKGREPITPGRRGIHRVERVREHMAVLVRAIDAGRGGINVLPGTTRQPGL